MDEILIQIQEIVKKILNCKSKIEYDDKLKNIGVNSLTYIQIVVLIENEFNIEFGDEDLNYNKFDSIREIGKYVYSLRS